MQTPKLPLATKYKTLNIYKRRHDQRYAVDCVLSWGDLGFINSTEIQYAIDFNEQWRNPLKWVTVMVFSEGKVGKQEAQEYIRSVHRTGSLSESRRLFVRERQSSIELMEAGASG